MLPKSFPHVPSVVLVAIAAFVSMAIAYRDIKVSAQLMLYLEGISVCLIAIVIALTLYRYGLHLDHLQFHLALLRRQLRGIGLGVMLAIFSFVGFESATTLGAEAREPAPHHPPRRRPVRPALRRLLRPLLLRRNPRLPRLRRPPRPERQPLPLPRHARRRHPARPHHRRSACSSAPSPRRSPASSPPAASCC